MLFQTPTLPKTNSKDHARWRSFWRLFLQFDKRFQWFLLRSRVVDAFHRVLTVLFTPKALFSVILSQKFWCVISLSVFGRAENKGLVLRQSTIGKTLVKCILLADSNYYYRDQHATLLDLEGVKFPAALSCLLDVFLVPVSVFGRAL